MANALFPRGRVRAGPEAIRAMEPRRVSGGRARALRNVPHRGEPPRRHERVESVRRGDDPQPELVRTVAYVQPGGGSRELEHQGYRGPAADRRVPPWHRVWPDGR